MPAPVAPVASPAAVDSRRMADGGAVGGASITNHIYVQNDIDVEALLFKLEDMQRRRR